MSFQVEDLMHENDERMEKEEEYEDESELDVGEAADLSPQNHILVHFIQGCYKAVRMSSRNMIPSSSTNHICP